MAELTDHWYRATLIIPGHRTQRANERVAAVIVRGTNKVTGELARDWSDRGDTAASGVSNTAVAYYKATTDATVAWKVYGRHSSTAGTVALSVATGTSPITFVVEDVGLSL